jgi:hypothetical protein
MHPDAILAGLKRELDRLDPHAADHADRKKAIEAEIKANEKLERPTATAEEPNTVIDRAHGYLAGLKRELERSAEGRHAEINAEIKRVEAAIKARGDQPQAAKVERATATPGETRDK